MSTHAHGTSCYGFGLKKGDYSATQFEFEFYI
mgnify:CR=1 FL=1